MTPAAQPRQDRPNCFNCRNFYITYEPAHPYGCRAMGFKSRKLPAMVVFESSSLECQLFVKKETGGG